MASRFGVLTVGLLLVTTLAVACGDDTEPRAATPVPTASFADAPGPTASPMTAAATATAPPASPVSTELATSTIPPTATAVDPSPTAMPDVPIGESGNSEIYVMNADGSEQTRLTDQPSMDGSPAWSPDGSMLAFLSYNGGSGGLYVMDADGSNPRQLSDAATYRPVWSPNGQQILVVSGHGYEGGYPEIYVVAVDGSGQQRLTSFENVPTATLSMGNIDPAWSPDGSRIAFIALQGDGPSEVHVMDADGANVRRLTDGPTSKWHPVWSPDGEQLAFTTDFPDPEVWVMNADGTGLLNLSNDPAFDIGPSWSPDGERVAFVRQMDAGSQIVLVNADGSNSTVIADGVPLVESLHWSPDGEEIVFAPFSSVGSIGIFVVNSDGSNLRSLTTGTPGDGEPAWSPDGTLIAFSSQRDGGQPVMCSWSSYDDLISVESLEALTWMARLVVVGTVVEELGPAFGGPGHRDMDGARSIYTDYLLEVESQYRGEPMETVRVRVSGGTLGDCVQTVDPTVSLAQGMRVLLFMFDEHADGDLPLAYLASVIGFWTVNEDGTISTPGEAYNPAGADGMTVDEVGALVTETLIGPPSSDAHWVIPIDESPATPQ